MEVDMIWGYLTDERKMRRQSRLRALMLAVKTI